MTKEESNEINKKISLAIISPFIILTAQYFILINMNLIATGGSAIIQTISKLLVVFSFIYALPAILKSKLKEILLIYLSILLIFLCHFLLFPENQKFQMSLTVDLFFMSLPLFIYAYSISDFHIFYNILVKASKLIFFIGTILALESLSGLIVIGAYSGPLANYLIIPTIVFLNESINKFRVKNIILFLISFSIIIIMGTRGPILTIVFFMIIKLVFAFDKKKTSSFIQYMIVVLTLILIFLNINNIIRGFNEILMNYGIQSRTLMLFMQEEVHLSGRDDIYNVIISEIRESPVMGFGIAGDRRILSFFDSAYAHNLILEVIGNFGFIFGTGVLLIFIVLIFKNLKAKKSIKKEIVLIWLSLGLVHLMVSSSYIIEMKFWILLGVLLNPTQLKKNNNKTKIQSDEKKLSNRTKENI